MRESEARNEFLRDKLSRGSEAEALTALMATPSSEAVPDPGKKGAKAADNVAPARLPPPGVAVGKIAARGTTARRTPASLDA